MSPENARHYERAIEFADRLQKLADDLGLFVVSDRIILIDKATGTSSTMQVMGRRQS